jgi:putative inorganic carbon (hco3(-)) transporter
VTALPLRQKINNWRLASDKQSAAGWQPAGFGLAAAVLGLLLAWLPLVWGAALVGGTAVFLLTLIQPLFGLGLVLLLGPLGALEKSLWGGSPLDSGQLMLLFVLGVWLAQGLSRRRVMVRHTFLNAPLALFIFVGALTLLRATAVVLGLIELLKWLEIAAVMLLVTDLAAEWFDRQADDGEKRPFFRSPQVVVLALLLLAGVSQALAGIWQFALRGDGPAHFLVLGRFYRAYGSFEQPNPFGGFMNLSVLLGAGVVLGLLTALWRRWRVGAQVGETSTQNLLILLLGVGLAAGLTGLALLFSWSRGAWLGFAAGTAVILFFWPRKLWQGAALLLVGGLLLWGGLQTGLVPASIAERLISFQDDLRFGDVRGVPINDANYAVVERLAHWQAAYGMAQDQVWLGIGFGNYGAVYADYALSNWPDALGHAHNYYLNLLAETGAVGLGAYLLLWAAVFWQTIRVRQRLTGWERGIALGLLGVWMALTVHHFVDKLYVNNMYVHLGVMFGLLQILDMLVKRKIRF